MAKNYPVDRSGLKVKISFKVRGTIVTKKFGREIDMPAQLATIIGRRMNQAAAAELHRKIKRKDASTGRLEAALLDERNIEVRGSHLRVMIPEFLYKEVPYWRAIDQGSRHFVGRRLVGVFTTEGEVGPFIKGAGGEDFLGPRHFGRGRAGSEARRLLDAAGYESSRVSTRVSKGIIGVRYSTAAREEFKRQDAEAIFRGIRDQFVIRRR